MFSRYPDVKYPIGMVKEKSPGYIFLVWGSDDKMEHNQRTKK